LAPADPADGPMVGGGYKSALAAYLTAVVGRQTLIRFFFGVELALLLY